MDEFRGQSRGSHEFMKISMSRAQERRCALEFTKLIIIYEDFYEQGSGAPMCAEIREINR